VVSYFFYIIKYIFDKGTFLVNTWCRIFFTILNTFLISVHFRLIHGVVNFLLNTLLIRVHFRLIHGVVDFLINTLLIKVHFWLIHGVVFVTILNMFLIRAHFRLMHIIRQ